MEQIRLLIKVVPQSGKQLFVWDQKQQVLKCFVKSAPEKNKVNEEVILLVSQKLGVSRLMISIIGGAAARRKTVLIKTDMSLSALHTLLGIEGDVGTGQLRIGSGVNTR